MYACQVALDISNSLQPYGLKPTRLLCPWDFSGKNTGVDFHSPLQGIFPTPGLNPGLLNCWQILCHLSQQGNCTPTLQKKKFVSQSTRNSKTYVLSKTVYSNINVITLFVSRPKKKLIFHVTGIISTIAGKFS